MSYPPTPDSDDQRPFTLAQMAPPAPKRRSRGLIIGAAAAVLVLLVGVGLIAYTVGTRKGGTSPAAAQPSTTTAAGPKANEVECVNVQRAYNAWNDLGLPKSSADVVALNEVTMSILTDDAKAFLAAVTGYDDKPSKQLAVAIAQYNFDLGLVNLELSVKGKIEPGERPDTVFASMGKVHEAYRAFKAATCT